MTVQEEILAELKQLNESFGHFMTQVKATTIDPKKVTRNKRVGEVKVIKLMGRHGFFVQDGDEVYPFNSGPGFKPGVKI